MTFTSADIRTTFLKYFERQGHTIVPASPLIPHNDPSLLFVNSGMVQFKNVFTGQETRPYQRATTVQKCIRAGGKHNDLENVGYTARHHTFFEMLGNFSFGNYFKNEAIPFAWELITKEFGLDPNRLYVTIYHNDEEAFQIWKKVTGFSDHKIIRIATSDNFWAMGDTGPCGPCSEIFYDHGDHIPGGLPGTPDQDGDRFIEIWNLVFMQFEQQTNGSRILLPKPSIDTGMGLERIAAILQGVHDNYDTDVMQSLIQSSMHYSNTDSVGTHKFSHRVIADHLRSAGFLIADGILPSNEGRGYVLRRIMRRAMRHAHMLGAQDLLMHKLVPTLVDKMGGAYPEIQRAQALITETLRAEESRFKNVLDRGLRYLEDETNRLSNGGILSGEVAFKLYDTYGFPLDLTQDILKNRQISVDTAGFQQSMEAQRQAARASWSGSGEQKTNQVWFDILDKHGPTEFLGYISNTGEGEVIALVKEDHSVDEADQASSSKNMYVITNQTPFYGESGGQMGDHGILTWENGSAKVIDTLKMPGALHVHKIHITKGTLKVKDKIHLSIDVERRQQLKANHSATHLLHGALRKYLGEVVTQKGSLVAADKLRFDFSFGRAMTSDELYTVAADVNKNIRQNVNVETVSMTPDEAISKGAMALFGEKYGESVRVVTMGNSVDETHSQELCGGTHVCQTGDIGYFKIVSEGSVSAGIRRIEAVTGIEAEKLVQDEEKILQDLALSLKINWKDLPKKVQQLLEDRKKLERNMSKRQEKIDLPLEQMPISAGGTLCWQILKDTPANNLKPYMDTIKTAHNSAVILLLSTIEEKVSALVGVTGNLVSNYNAQDLIKVIASALGSNGGGGRPDLAQCGGNDISLISAAIQKLQNYLK